MTHEAYQQDPPPQGRRYLARGVSPWERCRIGQSAPGGRQVLVDGSGFLPPLRGWSVLAVFLPGARAPGYRPVPLRGKMAAGAWGSRASQTAAGELPPYALYHFRRVRHRSSLRWSPFSNCRRCRILPYLRRSYRTILDPGRPRISTGRPSFMSAWPLMLTRLSVSRSVTMYVASACRLRSGNRADS